MRSAWLVLAFASGCLRSTEFHCETSDQCGAGGTCQTSVGYCSFSDPQCGQRFGPQAGMLAGTCVTPEQAIDAGVDAKSLIDGPPGSNCPTGYNVIPNGTPGHRYKLLATPDQWMQQVAACNGQSTYLMVPNDATELGATDALAGAAGLYWIGLDDIANEGTFVTVKNAPAPYLLWMPPAPDNGPPPENCVEAITASAMMNDDKCNTQLPAICECE
jgi:hypothetical protein